MSSLLTQPAQEKADCFESDTTCIVHALASDHDLLLEIELEFLGIGDLGIIIVGANANTLDTLA